MGTTEGARRRQRLLFARDATAVIVAVVVLSLLPGSRFGDHGMWGDAAHWVGRAVQWAIGLVLVGVIAIARFPGLLRSGPQQREADRDSHDGGTRQGGKGSGSGTGTSDERNP
ncbi:hypothetical protein ACPEEZ_00685 [Frigoribacterium sp. 2-23]|uniref:hypothetical protein n=1 Tax=Frigoribacterium sp. 2-23 TaxID=3415006 RepID=UPI003C6FB7E8